jgi:pimeloyl-[acyl-carrier protein] methyl ester esterase
MTAVNDVPIVLLPGMDGTGVLLAELKARLLRRRRVEVLSHPADPALGYDALTALVIERLPGERCVVLGESFSGPIAIEVAARAPQRVAGLVLAASFARSPLPALLQPLAGRLGPTWAPRWAIEAALLGGSGTPALKAALRDILATLPREVIRRRVAEVAAVDKRERLRRVACPILCLVGSRDRLVGRRCADEIAQAHPGCTIRVLDAPHMLLQTHAEPAADAIEAFYDLVGGALRSTG